LDSPELASFIVLDSKGKGKFGATAVLACGHPPFAYFVMCRKIRLVEFLWTETQWTSFVLAEDGHAITFLQMIREGTQAN
jgi:hypothetical protein